MLKSTDGTDIIALKEYCYGKIINMGIIDWERAMWGEPFMDDRFRFHNRHDDFLKGFGIGTISDEELRRIYWYDIYLYLIMMTEASYREYEDDAQYRWVKPLFDKIWAKLD